MMKNKTFKFGYKRLSLYCNKIYRGINISFETWYQRKGEFFDYGAWGASLGLILISFGISFVDSRDEEDE